MQSGLGSFFYYYKYLDEWHREEWFLVLNHTNCKFYQAVVWFLLQSLNKIISKAHTQGLNVSPKSHSFV